MLNNSQPNDNFGGDNREEENNKLNKGQKIAVSFLAIFAVLVIGLWAAQFKQRINEPFNSNINGNTSSAGGVNSNNEADLRLIDTDSDGLSDWDELNLYQTSPYLEDSDSDSLTDKNEINNNTDPNCPMGRDCNEAVAGTVDQNVADNSQNKINNNLNLANPANNENASSTGAVNQENIFQGNADAATLRKLLLDSGMDEAILSQISDEDLLKSYQQTLTGQ